MNRFQCQQQQLGQVGVKIELVDVEAGGTLSQSSKRRAGLRAIAGGLDNRRISHRRGLGGALDFQMAFCPTSRRSGLAARASLPPRASRVPSRHQTPSSGKERRRLGFQPPAPLRCSLSSRGGASPSSRSKASSAPNPRPRRLGTTDAVSRPSRARLHANVPCAIGVSATGSSDQPRRRPSGRTACGRT